MKHLKQWFKQAKTHYIARRWLSHANPDALAAHCLFYLNRIARRTQNRTRKQFIYACKNHLLRIFYQRGYCVALSQERQGLRCWHTWEYNDGEDDYCYKCQNTGWYRLHNLYRFVFEIGGRRYIWHQPEGLVGWSVEVTDPEVGEYHEYTPEPTGFSRELGDLYLAVTYEYLVSQGVPWQKLPPVLTLRGALRDEWYWRVARPLSRQKLRWRLAERRRWLRRWLDRQAQLKPGDWALLPEGQTSRQVMVSEIEYAYHWPYDGDRVALVEYPGRCITCLDGHTRPVNGRWKVDDLQPLGLRAKVAKVALAWLEHGDGWDEDEIPF